MLYGGISLPGCVHEQIGTAKLIGLRYSSTSGKKRCRLSGPIPGWADVQLTASFCTLVQAEFTIWVQI